MWVVYCNETGVEHNERFEYRSEALAMAVILTIDNEWQGYTYSTRLEA